MNNYHVQDIAQKYTHYDMIRNHTELPEYADIQTKLLYTFLSNGSEESANKELFALATSLLQLGLDTHDLVEENKVGENEVSRSKQLKVLAGDYFSGRFYQLLASAGQIDVIKLISRAVCEVNKIKMNFYERVKQLKLSADDYIQLTIDIKTALFSTFSKHMEGSFKNLWPEILTGYTRCEILSDELSRVHSHQPIEGSWTYWHLLQSATAEEKAMLLENEWDFLSLKPLLHKYRVYDKLHQMLETQCRKLKELISSYDGSGIYDELNELVMSFMHQLTSAKMLKSI